jgi:cell division protein FtsB
VRGSVRRAAAGGPAPAYVGLTTRAAVVGLVLCALVVSAALPLREYLSQRGAIAALEQTERTRRGEVAALQQQRALLADPTYVASLARERLHFVRPGETTYVVIGGQDPALTAEPGPAPRAAGPLAPWWSQLYGSVQAADGAAGR